MIADYYKFRGSYITLEDETKGKINITKVSNKLIFEYPCSSSSICTPYKISLYHGFYVFRLNGAGGGNSKERGIGGKGGYSEGILKVLEPKTIYLYLGGKGSDDETEGMFPPGGYNGGGSAYGDCGGGGGSTDIRLIGNLISNEESINTRILIAGGGGGGRQPSSLEQAIGGNGGGNEGSKGQYSSSYEYVPCIGSQDGCINGIGNITAGELWKGADAPDLGSGKGGSGGGGGYYGGGTCPDCVDAGGSGTYKYPIENGLTTTGENTGHGRAVIYFFNYKFTKNVNKQITYVINIMTSIMIILK